MLYILKRFSFNLHVYVVNFYCFVITDKHRLFHLILFDTLMLLTHSCHIRMFQSFVTNYNYHMLLVVIIDGKNVTILYPSRISTHNAVCIINVTCEKLFSETIHYV